MSDEDESASLCHAMTMTYKTQDSVLSRASHSGLQQHRYTTLTRRWGASVHGGTFGSDLITDHWHRAVDPPLLLQTNNNNDDDDNNNT